MTVVTEKIRVKINQNCIDSPFSVRFSNDLGGYDYYTFKKRQTYSYDTKNVKTQKKFIEDWKNDTSIIQIIQKTVAEKIKVGVDNLTLDEVDGLKYLIRSARCEYLFDSTNNVWHTLILDEGDIEIKDTGEDIFALELEFMLPERQIITQ